MELGAVLYEGPSILTGEPIVVILTGLRGSKNAKTGEMLQTWILRADVEPVEAVQTGNDAAICGGCPLRGNFKERKCYVNVGNGPTQVYRAWKRGRYSPAPRFDSLLRGLAGGRKVRLGAYGDPAAVPFRVWELLTSESAGWTGYTHQWEHPRFDPRILDLCMASVEDAAGVERLAQKFPSARYFRVRAPGENVAQGEMQCPASKEAGAKLNCANCLACNGGASDRRSVSIAAHGSKGFERKWSS